MHLELMILVLFDAWEDVRIWGHWNFPEICISLWASLSKAQTACFSPWIFPKVKVSGQLQWITINPVELCGKHLFFFVCRLKNKEGFKRASFFSVLSNEIIMLSLTKINHKEKEIGLEVNNYSLNFKYVVYPEWSEHFFPLGKITNILVHKFCSEVQNLRKGIQSKKSKWHGEEDLYSFRHTLIA